MNELKVSLKNCYGIQSLEECFDFSLPNKAKAYAVYAPNGLMKTSFTRTFDALSQNKLPEEERYGRPSSHIVESDGNRISREVIYVLKSEIDISSDSTAITDILVNPIHKARYDELLVELDKLKNKLISSLQKLSHVPKKDIEEEILNAFNEVEFSHCIMNIKHLSIDDDLSPYIYKTIFDTKSIDVLKSQEFIARASEFNERYQELFDKVGTIYQKGVFNPTKAELSFNTLDRHGFFKGGHRVHMRGEAVSIDKGALEQKLQAIHASIDGDEELKRIRHNLAQNAQTQALTDLIESLTPNQIEYVLEKLKPINQEQFRKELWIYYMQNNVDAEIYVASFAKCQDEIAAIEASAAQVAPKWTSAVELFNDRFVDMPFTLSVANQVNAALGKDKAKLMFTFKDGPDKVEWSRSQIKTLSQGERRALYLLNFIFEVEARKLINQETIFVIDDAADSFDYKNKHAIIQYLEDLCNVPNFHQIILTHNFDFFRTLANNFVHRDRCLMANRNGPSIVLTKAEGIKNYFIGVWKDKVANNDFILCATIPFTRNLIEYTKGENADYLKLTSLLHWKSDTEQITVGMYLDIYNQLFGTTHITTNTQPLVDLLFLKATEICARTAHDGLNLEDKVLLSIAIRLQAEKFLISELRSLRGDASYWCTSDNQFGRLVKDYLTYSPPLPAIRTLEKVSITVSSNIHLNSFMYEPILDLTIDHLVALHAEVSSLNV